MYIDLKSRIRLLFDLKLHRRHIRWFTGVFVCLPVSIMNGSTSHLNPLTAGAAYIRDFIFY